MPRKIDPDDPDEVYCRTCGRELTEAEVALGRRVCGNCRDDEGSDDA